jgi:hypothetical protein
MDLVGAQTEQAVPRRRGRGRPKLYEDRQYVKLTADQRAALEALVEAKRKAGTESCLADEIRAAIDHYRELMRGEAAMPA